MNHTESNVSNTPVVRQLAARADMVPQPEAPLWRVVSGALRIDSAPPGEPARFVRLALSGDVLGVEHWAGGAETLNYRALVPSSVELVHTDDATMMAILIETVVVAHQRSREAMELRTGPVSRRLKSLLLMFAQGHERRDAAAVECPVPILADLHDIIDAAPETISRVFGSMREMAFIQGRRPQKARFSSQVLRAQSLLPGMSVSPPAQRSLLVAA